jgi:hypothetical protein
MRQLAGTKTRCHWAHAAPLAGLTSRRVDCKNEAFQTMRGANSRPAAVEVRGPFEKRRRITYHSCAIDSRPDFLEGMLAWYRT